MKYQKFRGFTTHSTNSSLYFISSLFPVKLFKYDPRTVYSFLLQRSILNSIKNLNPSISDIKARLKEGGAYIQISNPSEFDINQLRAKINESNFKVFKSDIFEVLGEPFNEDMDRFPSSQLKIDFDGKEIDQEVLYKVLRKYGRIQDIESNKGYSIVKFDKASSSSNAKSSIHGFEIDGTKLKLSYQSKNAIHVAQWVMSHPKLVLPVVVFLIGVISYAIFDPIRQMSVENKLMDRFNFDTMKKKTLSLFSIGDKSQSNQLVAGEIQDRKVAFEKASTWLNESPSTFITITGPKGAGKSSLLKHLTKDRLTLTIDCAEVCKASNDAQLVTSLADQTGYWPIFGFFANASNLLDLASVGLIGSKAGFSSPIEDQLKQVLTITTNGLNNAKGYRYSHSKKNYDNALLAIQTNIRDQLRLNNKNDARYDSLGVISELGRVSEEDEIDEELVTSMTKLQSNHLNFDEEKEVVKSLPIIVINNFDVKGANRDILFDVLSSWAAGLVTKKSAQVIFASDNVTANKRLTKYLPNKPLNAIGLTDADKSNSLKYVNNRLSTLKIDLSNEDKKSIDLIGGRIEDLEDLVHKVRSGLSVKESVTYLISTSANEIRQNILQKNNDKPYSQEQAWLLIKKLSSDDKISYSSILTQFPFNYDEAALQTLENHGLITLIHQGNRPDEIIAGKPIYVSAFKNLVNDTKYRALQDLNFNKLKKQQNESKIRSFESELLDLKTIGVDDKYWFDIFSNQSPIKLRFTYLLKQIQNVQTTINKIDKESDKLLKLL